MHHPSSSRHLGFQLTDDLDLGDDQHFPFLYPGTSDPVSEGNVQKALLQRAKNPVNYARRERNDLNESD